MRIWSPRRHVGARQGHARGEGKYWLRRARKEYVDLIEAGIVDPNKVVRVALENAVSVVSVLLLSEATMTELPEPKRERLEAEPAL